MTDRRTFLRACIAGTGMIAVPRLGRWYRQGSGLILPDACFDYPNSGAMMEVAGLGFQPKVVTFRGSIVDIASIDADGFTIDIREADYASGTFRFRWVAG